MITLMAKWRTLVPDLVDMKSAPMRLYLYIAQHWSHTDILLKRTCLVILLCGSCLNHVLFVVAFNVQ